MTIQCRSVHGELLCLYIHYYVLNVKRQSITLHPYIPGHELALHMCVSVFVPLHVFPPAEGAGLLHILDLVLVPLPHVTVQEPYFPQSLHPPSAVE